MDRRLAIDVGGSAIKYALMGENHQIIEQGKVAAPREYKDEFVEAVGQLYDRYADQIQGNRTPKPLFAEIRSDRPFVRRSGGGRPPHEGPIRQKTCK